MDVTITQKVNQNFGSFLRTVFALLGLLCFSVGYAQLTTTVNSNANQLVQTLLGQGLSYSNATLTCPSSASATFVYVPDGSFSFSAGVVLTTGKINGSPVLNAPASSFFSTSMNVNGDAQLDNLAGGSGYDACVLEFDFEPLGDTVKFKYIFGSEEYPEYVCSSFNDVFGFFVSGPNPAGGNYVNRNIALIPGTNVPVAINAVNSGSVGTWGSVSNCSAPDGSLAYSSYYYNNLSGTRIVFDGLTKTMTAMIAVKPCSTYHMKLGVEDQVDDAYDSGVFLEKGSLSSNFAEITSSTTRRPGAVSNNSAGFTVGEGCDTGYVKFKVNPRLSDFVLHYTVGGTATNGVDYEQVADSVLIAVGDSLAEVAVITLPDALVEGTETVKMYISGLCSPAPIDSIVINIIDALTLSLEADRTVCRDSSTVLFSSAAGGSGNYDYTWTPALGLSSPTVANPVATLSDTTLFILTIRDSVSCPVSDSILIRVRDCNGLVLFTDKDTVCPGDQVQLHATLYRSGFSQWTSSSGSGGFSDATLQSPLAVVSDSTTFYYSVQLLDGSILTDSITVYIDTTASVVAIADSVQCSNAITFSATASGNQSSTFQYTWVRSSDTTVVGMGQTVNTVQSVGTETYYVELHGGYCVVRDTVTITANPATNDTVIVNACLAQLPYSWNGQSLTSSGTYTHDTINVYGCDSIITLTFSVVPILVDSQAVVICFNQQTSYAWNGEIITSSGVYRDTLPSSYGCDSITILNLIVDSMGFTAPTQTNVLCYGASTGMIISSALGGAGTVYSWTYNGGVYTPSGATVAMNLAAGFYTQIAVDSNSCRDTATFEITQPSQIRFIDTSVINISCNGGNDGSMAINGIGGTGVVVCSLPSGVQQGVPVTYTSLTAGSYTATLMDENGCTVDRTFTITEPTVLSLELSATIDPCSKTPSGIITSQAGGGVQDYQYYLSQNSYVLQNNAIGTFNELPAGSYNVELRDSNNCSITQSVIVPARNIDVFTAETRQPSCYGDEYKDGRIVITPSGVNAPYRYSIEGSTFSYDSGFYNLVAGIYDITVLNSNGCDTVLRLNVPPARPGIAVVNPNDTTIEIGEQIMLDAQLSPYSTSDINSYHWYPSDGLSCDDCPNPTVSSYARENEYQLTITYNDICEAKAMATVIVSGEGAIYIPNAFSPNGDGNNDYFEIYGKIIKTAKVQVFNRWGEKVYDSVENPLKWWDGTFNGSLQPPMIYTYIAEIEFLDGKVKRQMGSLTLIR